MASRTKKAIGAFVAGFVIIFISAIIFFTNRWIESDFKEAETTHAPRVKPFKANTPKTTKRYSKEVIRKTRLEPNRKFSESIFFIGDEEVARYKSRGDVVEEIYDIQGEIPNGWVKFFNDSRNTYGEEYYLNGKRHGRYKEYYDTGKLKKTLLYAEGNVLQIREYFSDGKLRMEANYENALDIPGEREVGTGKIYFRNGTLMYEWHMTNFDERYYKRSYNIEGKLVEEKTFNSHGKLLETQRF